MDRRTLIGSLALGVLAVPGGVRAQPVPKIYRIGILGLGPKTSAMTGTQPQSPFARALLDGLRALGYVYGENFLTEARGAEGKLDRIPDLVAELLRLQVDVIVAVFESVPALKQATSTIPIVVTGGDLVGGGHVQSLGHPGGNLTGLSNQNVDLIGKRLELLKQLVPTKAPIGIVWSDLIVWQTAEAAALGRGWKVLSLEIRNAGESEAAFRAATKARAGSVLVMSSFLVSSHVRAVTELAAQSRMPAMYANKFYVEAGGLMSYAADLVDIWRRTAVYVHKILKGAKAGDLPIEQPSKFEFVINLKTAKALGLTIPPALLGRADEVIQ